MSSKENKVLEGTVVSCKMQNTLVVAVERRVKHPFYSKIIRRTTKYYVHNPAGEYTVGAKVKFTECKPISKTVKWVLV